MDGSVYLSLFFGLLTLLKLLIFQVVLPVPPIEAMQRVPQPFPDTPAAADSDPSGNR